MKKVKLYLLLIVLSFFVSCSSPSNTDSAEKMVFNMEGAVAVALTQENIDQNNFQADSKKSINNRSNLKKVDIDGNLLEILSSGWASISKFMIAPNSKMYIQFTNKIDLATSLEDEAGCLLVEVDTNSGQVKGIDYYLDEISWNDYSAKFINDPIQFDSTGAIYYRGTYNNREVLRKFNDGSVKSLINDNILIYDFVVNNDGSTIITGKTVSSNTKWIRKIQNECGLENILTSFNSEFIYKFPDNNVYMGLWLNEQPGVYRYLVDNESIESKSWISELVWITKPEGSYHDIYDFITEAGGNSLNAGVYVKNIVSTSDNEVFAQVELGNTVNKLFKYYPDLGFPSITIDKVSLIKSAYSKILIAGLNASNVNQLLLYNPITDTQQNLLPSHNIEIYNLAYSGLSNRVMFHGLNFNDNQIVLGSIDIDTMTVKITNLGNDFDSKLINFDIIHFD